MTLLKRRVEKLENTLLPEPHPKWTQIILKIGESKKQVMERLGISSEDNVWIIKVMEPLK
jgi:hypothetical protein